MSSFWIQFIINVVEAVIKELPNEPESQSVKNILTVIKNQMEQHPILKAL
jgi:hypothetical protein